METSRDVPKNQDTVDKSGKNEAQKQMDAEMSSRAEQNELKSITDQKLGVLSTIMQDMISLKPSGKHQNESVANGKTETITEAHQVVLERIAQIDEELAKNPDQSSLALENEKDNLLASLDDIQSGIQFKPTRVYRSRR